MKEKNREKYYFERDDLGHLTGLTVCSIEGYLGFASCYPGKVVVEEATNAGLKQMLISEVAKADIFSKKVGKEVAKGRAHKLAGLITEGITEAEALDKLYSGRMKTRIREYADREIVRQENRPQLELDFSPPEEILESNQPN